MPWLVHNLFTEVFKRSAKEFVFNLLKYTVTAVFSVIVSYFVCNFINGYSILLLISRGVICLVISNIIWILSYRKSDEMVGTISIVKRILKR